MFLTIFCFESQIHTAGTRPVNRRPTMTAEQLATQRAMNRDREIIRRQNMTEDQRATLRERDRIRHRGAKEKLNLPSASTGNNVAHLFECVSRQHVQAEVEGYTELGHQHGGKL
ncbi:hypothetical protein MKX03_007445 [Papaver bracteatum]|nr:hypothetical protein MKX03_007445 [Papaver bracteatum]